VRYAARLSTARERTPTASPLSLQDADRDGLLARLSEAQEALRARDDFLAVAAHELRSPLHALALRVAALERMAARTGDAVLQPELQRMRRSVDRYVRRAVTLLDLSKLHAGVLAPVPAWVRAADVVRSVVEDYREEALFRGASLTADVQDDVVGWWDPHMLEQILANLASNAIKYGQGTPVTLRVSSPGDGSACFEVSDRGPGVPQAHRQRIFEKFERIVTRDSAGYGLGLWIVGRMVAAHQGSIAVTDAPGGGALFRVTLPLRGPGAPQETSKP
jgi:two-component system, OmpR family, sensor kinase